jgi:hypothetical protein
MTMTIIAAAVIAIVIPVAPVWSIIPPVISVVPRITVVRITVIGIGIVVARPVIGREWNGECKGKVNTGACGRFSEERQSRDGENEDDKLLHKEMDETNISRIQEIVAC